MTVLSVKSCLTKTKNIHNFKSAINLIKGE